MATKKRRPTNRIRPSRETRFKRIRTMDCFQDMKDRMLAGWPIEQLARFIQNDQEELTDLAEASVCTMLREYRKTIPPGDFVSEQAPPDIVEQRMRPFHEEALKKFKKGLNELEEVERLYRMQMERIEVDAEVEKRQKKLISSMTQEMRLAKEFLMDSAKLKMDLGIKKRHLGVIENESRLIADVGERYQDKRVLAAMKDSQSRQRLTAIAGTLERFMLTDGEGDEKASMLEDLAEIVGDLEEDEDSKAELKAVES